MKKRMHLGAFVGFVSGSLIEWFVGTSHYAPGIAHLLVKGGRDAIMPGAFYGGVLIGGTVGLFIAGVLPSQDANRVMKAASAGLIDGAVFGALIWGLHGLPLQEIGFGVMGGPLIGIAAGGTVGWVAGRES